MTFDVPVKILSSHLLLLSAVVLAPQLRRLADVLVFARPAAPVTQPALFDSPRRNRIAGAVQVTIGMWMLVGATVSGWTAWNTYGGGAPEPELHGMWAVTEFERDGVAVPPLLTDENRWQRLVFEAPGAATVQHMDGSLQQAEAVVDLRAGTLAVLDPGTAPAEFVLGRPAPDRLTLDGSISGSPVRMTLQLEDPQRFTLLNRGFHWVQDYPYFR